MIGGASELHAMVDSGQLEHVLTKHAGKPALPHDLAKAVERSKAQVSAAIMPPRSLNMPFLLHMKLECHCAAQAAGGTVLLPGGVTAEEYAALQDLTAQLRTRLADQVGNHRADRSPSLLRNSLHNQRLAMLDCGCQSCA